MAVFTKSAIDVAGCSLLPSAYWTGGGRAPAQCAVTLLGGTSNPWQDLCRVAMRQGRQFCRISLAEISEFRPVLGDSGAAILG